MRTVGYLLPHKSIIFYFQLFYQLFIVPLLIIYKGSFINGYFDLVFHLTALKLKAPHPLKQIYQG